MHFTQRNCVFKNYQPVNERQHDSLSHLSCPFLVLVLSAWPVPSSPALPAGPLHLEHLCPADNLSLPAGRDFTCGRTCSAARAVAEFFSVKSRAEEHAPFLPGLWSRCRWRVLDWVLEIQRQGVLGARPKWADSLVSYSRGSVSETSPLAWDIVSVKAGTVSQTGVTRPAMPSVRALRVESAVRT